MKILTFTLPALTLPKLPSLPLPSFFPFSKHIISTFHYIAHPNPQPQGIAPNHNNVRNRSSAYKHTPHRPFISPLCTINKSKSTRQNDRIVKKRQAATQALETRAYLARIRKAASASASVSALAQTSTETAQKGDNSESTSNDPWKAKREREKRDRGKYRRRGGE